MLEEQGRGLLKGVTGKVLKWMMSILKSGYDRLEAKAVQNKTETGKQKVKQLVRKGRDLELTEVIQNEKHLKEICKQCKKQGMAFAVKKEKDGGYRLLYQRKDSTLVSEAVGNALKKEYKQKTPLKEILNRNKQIKQPEHSINTPLKHREVNAR